MQVFVCIYNSSYISSFADVGKHFLHRAIFLISASWLGYTEQMSNIIWKVLNQRFVAY